MRESAEYVWLAEQMTGVEAAVLAKASRLDLADSALHAPAAVGLEHGVKQIAHGASVALLPCGSLASSDYVAAGRPVCPPSIRARIRSEASRSCRSSAALNASMTRARTFSTCPGALATSRA